LKIAREQNFFLHLEFLAQTGQKISLGVLMWRGSGRKAATTCKNSVDDQNEINERIGFFVFSLSKFLSTVYMYPCPVCTYS
jgi:hypothetical protein